MQGTISTCLRSEVQSLRTELARTAGLLGLRKAPFSRFPWEVLSPVETCSCPGSQLSVLRHDPNQHLQIPWGDFVSQMSFFHLRTNVGLFFPFCSLFIISATHYRDSYALEHRPGFSGPASGSHPDVGLMGDSSMWAAQAPRHGGKGGDHQSGMCTRLRDSKAAETCTGPTVTGLSRESVPGCMGHLCRPLGWGQTKGTGYSWGGVGVQAWCTHCPKPPASGPSPATCALHLAQSLGPGLTAGVCGGPWLEYGEAGWQSLGWPRTTTGQTRGL